ncbi:DUF1772 domain-containing protein [Hoeflea sp. WL0058]|uniref:DUF1772 domain-containing protein n=1 Tax=Flavimaribacter sediminis TaxID=2865987 RepID=A0AAE3CZR4_9HYPH|nr:anthrone oxygenase family protein [Flavimaribacter sediminis]MBW8636954.1 DUF1772 domain-containing protein [Flavimaribacter sediminis]
MSLVKTLSISSILFCGAIFGFFYAWVCSTMWGLDQADPRIAIAAMQAMNASVRNGVFFPAFFLTPVVLAATAGVAYRSQFRSAAHWFAAAGLVYLIFGLLLTMGVNVPMNEALAKVDIPGDVEAAEIIWQDYSPSWQFWNQLRTIASGIALTFAGIGLSKV